MRTACLVIATMLFSIAASCYPQGRMPTGGVDQEITVTGSDETALPVPPPGLPEPPVVPDLDLGKPAPPMKAPIQPPSGAWAAPPAEWRVKDPLALDGAPGARRPQNGG